MDQHYGAPGSLIVAPRADSSRGLAAHAVRSYAFDRLSAIAAVLDGTGTIVDTNAAWRLFAHLNDGSTAGTGPGVNYLEVCDRAADAGSATAAAFAAGLREILDGSRESFDLDYPCPSPTEDRWFMVQATAAPIDGGSGVVLFHVDISGRKLLESSLASEALHDELTGLPNRRKLVRFVEDELARIGPTGRPMQALYLDVNGFKAVNDTHGHHVGDQLLVQIAARARRVLRSGDLLGRIGGDEFVLALPGAGVTEASAVANRLHEVMAAPFQVGSTAITVGVSIGIATSTSESTVDSLLAAADGELYRGRNAGGGVGRNAGRSRPSAAAARPVTIAPTPDVLPRFTRGMTDAVVAYSNDLVMLFQGDGTIDWVSPAALRVFGFAPEELVGTNGFALVHPDDQARVFADFASIPNQGDTVRTEFRVQTRVGDVRWVEEIATNLMDEPNVAAVVGNVRDITERKAGEEAAALLSAIVESSSDAIYSVGLDGIITTWNDGAARLYGYEPSEVIGRSVALLVPLDRVDERVEVVGRIRRGETIRDCETVRRHADGHDLQVSLALSPVRDGSGAVVGVSTIARDITERHAAEVARLHEATHDTLTGLLNRAGLVRSLSNALDDQGKDTGGVVVAMLDLDRFQTINDTAGHDVGDQTLRAVAERLQAGLDATDDVARVGGDEFVVVRRGVTTLAGAAALAAAAHAALHDALDVGHRQYRVTASIGVTLSDTLDTAESLLRDADAAVYQAKDSGRARTVMYDGEARSRVHRRQTIESALGRAQATGQLRVAYQPALDLSTGQVAGFEALLRWTHPVLGVISPAEFIPLAESSGLIVTIGDWVIGQVLSQLAAWRQAHVVPDDLWIAINLSASQLADTRLAERLATAIAIAGLPSGVIHLELTESVLVDRIENATASVLALRAVGVKISIDDFGTGYSSLAYLDRLPIDILKIDRSFVDRLGDDRPSTSIVEAVISLADSLGLDVVAEGVETEDQLRFMREHGCGFGQGFLWSPALTPDDAVSWMLNR